MNRPWGNQFNAQWADEHDKALREHLLAGLSSSQTAAAINAEFGTVYTRNAVIGRANRTGAERGKLRKKHKRIKAQPRIRKRKEPPMTKSIPPKPVSALRIADVIPLHLPLLELGPNMCRWPFGEGPVSTVKYSFCGNPTLDECPYCYSHLLLSMRERAA